MKLRLSECDYEHLRPPKDVFNVTHSDYYIKHGEGKKAVRKIFEDLKYPEDELEKLREFEALVAKENIALPSNWTKTDNIKMMYAGKFDFKKCIKLMKLHTEWRASPDRGTISPEALKIMEDGLLYISGRDKQYRPIIILNCYKIDLKKTEVSVLIEALNFVLDTCIKFYFVPGKVENWIFIIETNGVGLINFPFKVIKSINDATAVNYTSRLHQLYIMNPSPFLGASWKMVHGFLDPETASKIFMLKKSEFGKLLEHIAPNQLEERYGGTLPTPNNFWPPTNTLSQPPYTKELQKEIEITKSQAIEAIRFVDSSPTKLEEVKLEGARSKRNSALFGNGGERNSPEIIINAEQSSTEEQKFAKAAKEGQTEEENRSPESKQKKKLSTDAKDFTVSSPIQGILRENVRRSSKQLEPNYSPPEKEKPVNSGYTVNVNRVETPQAHNEVVDQEEEVFEGGAGQESTNKKVKSKASGVTFAVDEPSKDNGVVLEGTSSFKNDMCGFCRPKTKSSDEHTNPETSSCNMF